MAARRRPNRPARTAPSARPVSLDHLPKISATLIEFSRPLLDALPPVPTIENMRHVMQLATIAWNLPIVEDEPDGEGQDLRALYDRQMKLVDAPLREMLDAMLHDRRARWGHDPRLVANVEVTREPKEFKIVATASILGRKPSR